MSGAPTHEHAERRAHREALVERLRELYPGAWGALLLRLCSPSAPHEHRGQPCRQPGKVPVEGARWNETARARFERGDDQEIDAHIEALAAHVTRGGNVGLALPEGTLALDTDTAESTGAVAGMVPYNTPRAKTAKGGHCVFALPGGFEATASTDADLGAGLRADLRVGGRSQLACAPSIHATGTPYTWEFGLPEHLDDLPELPAELRVRLERAGALRRRANGQAPPAGEGDEQAGELPEGVTADGWRAAVERLARLWPAQGEGGARHSAQLALAGALVRAGWSREHVVRLAVEVLRASGADDTARGELERFAREASERIAAGRRVTGWRTLRKQFGELAVAAVRQRLGLESEDAASAATSLARVLDPDAGRIEGLFDEAGALRSPAARRFLIETLVPAQTTGFLTAPGSTGKGHLQIALAVSAALGEAVGPYAVPRPFATALFWAEDDLAEFHRRLDAHLRMRFAGDSPSAEQLEAIRERIRVWPLRGQTGAVLGDDFIDLAAAAVAALPDAGVIFLDPLGKFLPPGAPALISTEAAALITRHLDHLSEASGCTVLAVHHANQWGLREGRELEPTAMTGSMQLRDFARVVLQLKRLSIEDAKAYGVTSAELGCVELRVTKSNYGPDGLAEPFLLVRGAGGALWYTRARRAGDVVADKMFKALLRLGAWATREKWEKEAHAEHGIARDRARAARQALEADQRVVRHRVRQAREDAAGGFFRDLFAPAADLRPASWPAPPSDAASSGGSKAGRKTPVKSGGK